MSPTQPLPQTVSRPVVRPFPQPGALVRAALHELHIAATGTAEQRRKLGDPARLARPWEPATCRQPALRAEVWQWLDQVVDWLNHEHVWDVATTVPACWPQHPHLVHQIAVLADQRRRAAEALTSDALEDWHRYGLPAAWERIRSSVHGHCDDGHQPWPATSRYIRYVDHAAARARCYSSDVQDQAADDRDDHARPAPDRPRLEVVDTTTGELHEGP